MISFLLGYHKISGKSNKNREMTENFNDLRRKNEKKIKKIEINLLTFTDQWCIILT